MAHEVFWWHKKLDTETLPEAILAVLWVLHKNLSCSFDLFSLGSKNGAWWTSIWRSAISVRWNLAVISLSSFLSLCLISGRNAPATVPHAKEKKKKTGHILPLTCCAPTLLSSTNQMPFKEIWLRLCVTFELKRWGKSLALSQHCY